jgi:Ca2+-binding RTX toxin-like protein
VRGQAGNDVLSDGTSAKDGADTFDGGLGFDRMSYVTRTAPLAALIDQTADDGELGENDNLIGIDSVTLGSGADRFLSFVDDGEDEVFGGAGNDVIRTGAGDDTLNGGTGVDELTAASGNDVISAQDGVKDTIACGDGTDTLFGDLQDATSTGCESKSLSPKGEPMPLLVKPRARVSGAKLVLDVECAKNHRSPCRGVMRVSGARATSFKVKAGKRAKLRVRLGAKRSGLVASLSEKGRKGTRTTEAALVLP